MINFKAGTNIREQAGSVFACTVIQLFVALKSIHVRSRPTHIHDRSLEKRVSCDRLYFIQYRVFTARLDSASLMNRN